MIDCSYPVFDLAGELVDESVEEIRSHRAISKLIKCKYCYDREVRIDNLSGAFLNKTPS